MGIEIETASLTELAESVEAPTMAPKKRVVGLTHTFNAIYKGQSFTFTSQVPTVGAHIKRGQVVAQLIGGSNYAALPFDTRALVDAIAKCSVHLVQKPDWFDALINSHVPQAVFEIAAEVDRHHAEWFQLTAGVDQDGSLRPIVVIEGGLGAVLPKA